MAISPSGQRRRGRPPKGTRGDTRQELIDAALRLFARQGYTATTVRQIADEVGIRDSAIYAHFNAKGELLDALIGEAGPQCFDQIGIDFDRLAEQPPDDVLPSLFERLLAEWDRPRQRELVSLITREGFGEVPGILGAVHDRFRDHVQQWVEDGQLRDDIATELLLWELLTPLVAIRILYLHAQAPPAWRKEGRRLAAEHVKYFLGTATP